MPAETIRSVAYGLAMRATTDVQSAGRVFDAIADEYDRHRPTYPDELVDRACRAAGLEPGARVLEVGCGSGQLTGSLLARGLRVTAVEPGAQLVLRARGRLDGAGDAEFVNRRLEDAALTDAGYPAVFSASAFHWIDPEVSWRLAADALVDGGTLALICYFGLREPHSAADQQALQAIIAGVAPELAAAWPAYRELNGTLAGVAERRGNVSEVWSWLGGWELARSYAAGLFDDVRISAIPAHLEHTAEQLTALLSTMSFWAPLSPRQRDALAAEIDALHQRLGRPIRSGTVACLVTARRVARR